MKNIQQNVTITPDNDLWDPIYVLQEHKRYQLTSIEMTMTNVCNMRCEHCAVGDQLVFKDAPFISLDLMLRRLDELEHLQTISLTGGEPFFLQKNVEQVMLPILKYAKDRGLQTQINSNLTLDYERYEWVAPYVDVMHISFNYTSYEDFYEIGFAHANHPVSKETARKMYEQMIENARRLSDAGVFVSAETMINYRTHNHLPRIHELIVEMGCKRQEVHPMYPSDFASHLPVLPLEKMKSAIEELLAHRDPNVWILFGTLPFYHCSPVESEREFLQKLKHAPNVTVRNDPDGRNRLNVDLFSGNVHVTDFTDLSSVGNIHEERLDEIFARWLEHPLQRQVSCYCPAVQCCGPNLLVKDMYYREVDFTKRSAILDE